MTFVIKTPNELYNGVTEGVQFEKGIGKTDDKNIRNILVNDYKYEDITNGTENNDEVTHLEDGIDVEELTVDQLKDLAKQLGLSNYSKLKRDELIELIEKNA